MSRWWRAYDEAINDPKLLKLSDAMHRAWFTLLCVASKNDGKLPPTDDIALMLRVKPAKIAEWITKLVSAGLIDRTESGFEPHNWNVRQYRSDVTDPTNATRQKRYRDRHRNGSNGVTDKRPETEADTEQKQKEPEANASGADAPRDYRSELFGSGLARLAVMTGKGPDACRSFVGKCLKASGDDAVTVLGLIEDAERNRVVDPSAWIAARLKATGPPAKPLTAFQESKQTLKDIRNDLKNFASGGGPGGGQDTRLLPGHSGERPDGVRGGPGAAVIDLPTGSHRSRG